MKRNDILIAKNSIFLYIRLLITMFIAFFSSRILLQVLGIEDFGVYGIIGGIAIMFASLKGSFTSAVQRFCSYTIGIGDSEKLIKIFNTAYIIHILLAIILILTIELIGLWLINCKLNLPETRLDSAYIVFHFTVLTTAISTIIIPFDSLIISHEKMDFYATISIADSVTKLLIIYLIQFSQEYKLELYAILIALIQLINLICTHIYCYIKFEECKIKWIVERKTIKDMAVFAGWNFIGNTAFVIGNEVSNFLLNIFGGVTINASRTISYQIKSGIQSFLSNAMIAVRPQATQEYAARRLNSFFTIFFFMSKTMFFLTLLMAAPIFIHMNDILIGWLGIIPPYCTVFTRLILFQLLIRSFHEPIDVIFKSSGNLKYYQSASMLSTIIVLPLMYLFLKANWPIYSVFILMCFMEFIEWIFISFLAKHEGLKLQDYIKKVIFPCIIVFCFSLIICIIYTFFLNNRLHLFIGIASLILFNSLSIWFLGYSNPERQKIKSLILSNKQLQ